MDASATSEQQRINRLLIVGCSRAKRKTEQMLPALERYDGPVFRVIRKQLSHCEGGAPDIYVLSGRFGLIPASDAILDYDHVMTSEDFEPFVELVCAQLADVLAQTNYCEVLVHASGLYLTALRDAWSRTDGPHRFEALGPPGARLGIVRSWLTESPISKPAERRHDSSLPPRIRGVRITMTKEAALALAERALAGDFASGADRFFSAAVPIGERLVSPKWFVALITGLSLKQFGTSEAVRVLNQLGIKTVARSQQPRQSEVALQSLSVAGLVAPAAVPEGIRTPPVPGAEATSGAPAPPPTGTGPPVVLRSC